MAKEIPFYLGSLEDRMSGYQVSMDYQTRYKLKNAMDIGASIDTEFYEIKSKEDVKRLLLHKMENKERSEKEASLKRKQPQLRLTSQAKKTGSADNAFKLRRAQESPMRFLNQQIKKAEADLLKPAINRASNENSSAPVRRVASMNKQASIAAAYNIKQKQLPGTQTFQTPSNSKPDVYQRLLRSKVTSEAAVNASLRELGAVESKPQQSTTHQNKRIANKSVSASLNDLNKSVTYSSDSNRKSFVHNTDPESSKNVPTPVNLKPKAESKTSNILPKPSNNCQSDTRSDDSIVLEEIIEAALEVPEKSTNEAVKDENEVPGNTSKARLELEMAFEYKFRPAQSESDKKEIVKQNLETKMEAKENPKPNGKVLQPISKSNVVGQNSNDSRNEQTELSRADVKPQLQSAHETLLMTDGVEKSNSARLKGKTVSIKGKKNGRKGKAKSKDKEKENREIIPKELEEKHEDKEIKLDNDKTNAPKVKQQKLGPHNVALIDKLPQRKAANGNESNTAIGVKKGKQTVAPPNIEESQPIKTRPTPDLKAASSKTGSRDLKKEANSKAAVAEKGKKAENNVDDDGNGGDSDNEEQSCRYNIINSIRPVNVESEKTKFFKNKFDYNPLFKYYNPLPPEVLQKYSHASDMYLPQAVKIMKFVIRKYGSYENFESTNGGRVLTRQEIIGLVKDYCRRENFGDGEIILNLSEDLLSTASMTRMTGPHGLLCVRVGDIYESWIEGLLRHELSTHYVRSVNNMVQPWAKNKDRKKFKLYPVNPTEEGLASIHTVLLRQDPLLFRNALLYFSIAMAAKLSFKDLFLKLGEFIHDPHRRWDYCMRAKRGQVDTSKPGCFAKDQVYLTGSLHILKNRKSIDFQALMKLGKISFEDVEKLKKSGSGDLKHESLRLPSFMQNMKFYKSRLDVIMKANGLTDQDFKTTGKVKEVDECRYDI